MHDANLFCVATAAAYPSLIMRHLGLLSRLLRGRTHHDFKDFKENRHIDFFTNFASILVILGPRLYHQHYRTYLLSILGKVISFHTK